MLVKINLVVIFVSLSLGLPVPLSQDKPLTNTTLLDLPTTSPPLVEAEKMEQSVLVKEMAKVNKGRSPAMEEAAKMKNSEKTSKEKTSLGRKQRMRRRRRRIPLCMRSRRSRSMRSRRRRIPLCMARCLSLGLLHPAQCHFLCS